MWLYCCPWYLSPWIAYLSSCSPQCDRSAETIGDRQGNGGDHEVRRGGSLRGCCRRLASSPSASEPASAAAVARGKLWRPGVSTRGEVPRFLPFSRPRAQIYPPKSSDRASGAPWRPAGRRHSAVRPRWDLAAENLARVRCGLQCQAYSPTGYLRYFYWRLIRPISVSPWKFCTTAR
jgi:hypothetical protein